MPKVLAIIPARAGSKGVVDKNIRVLGGHNLIAWTIAACKKAKLIDRIIVSTDSRTYARIAKDYGAEVPFLRPENLASDYSSDYEFVIHAIDWLAERNEEPDFIAHMRPTTPFRTPEIIDEAINAFISDPKATALRSVHEMAESAYKTFEIDPSGNLRPLNLVNSSLDSINNPRQGFPKTYIANGYVDMLSTKYIRKNGLLHGDCVASFMTPIVTEVDNMDDFQNLEYQLTQSPDTLKKLFE